MNVLILFNPFLSKKIIYCILRQRKLHLPRAAKNLRPALIAYINYNSLYFKPIIYHRLSFKLFKTYIVITLQYFDL